MEILSINGFFVSSVPKKKRTRRTTPTIRTNKKKKPSSISIASLPDDLVLRIIARVSRLYYPTLSLVSKRFRSLLASTELYKIRSLLGHTESCLYVCLSMHSSRIWFTLGRKPEQTSKKNNKSSDYVLAKVPIPHSPHANFSSLVAVGSNIYNIGASQSMYKASSSTVSVLDCTTHSWRELPSLSVELFTVYSSVLDRKIYVAGKFKADGDNEDDPFRNTIEVFDTRTQVWDPDPIPCSVAKEDMPFYNSACIDGKFHVVAGSKVFAYDAKEGRWDLVGPDMSSYMFSHSHCEVDNVLYSVSDGVFMWYDTELRSWRDLKGLVGLPKFPPEACVRLADYGGKLAVFWFEIFRYGLGYKNKIWCAEIALERCKSGEIWGKVEWFDHVLTVPMFCGFQKVLAATV